MSLEGAVGLVLAVIGLVFAFSAPRSWFVRVIGLDKTLEPERSELISLRISESSHDTYFEIPSADHNDYPGYQGRSAVQIRMSLAILAPIDATLHSTQLYLYRHEPMAIAHCRDPGPAIAAVSGNQIRSLMVDWGRRNPALGELEIKSGRSTTFVVPKYALVDPGQFHKSESPFHACLVLNVNDRFIRTFVQLPQAGTTVPRFSMIYEVLRELGEGQIADFCKRAYEAGPKWQGYVDIEMWSLDVDRRA